MSRTTLDLALYLVTDATLAGDRSLSWIVRRAIEGGATAVQLREKSASTAEFVALASSLREITSQAGVALIVNDRIDVALAVEADGVHLGQQDMPATLARRLLGHERWLGVTVSGPEEARRAAADGADYLGTRAVFATSTKTDGGAPLGLERLREIVRASRLPVVAIGGIHAGNADAVLGTGVAGVAVVSAIVAAADPRAAAERLAIRVRGARL